MTSVDAPKAVARFALAIFAALVALFVFVVVTDTPVAAQDQAAQEAPQVFADPGASAGDRYIVKYRDRGRARDAVRGRKGHVVLELPDHGVIAARLTDEGRQELEADPSVEYVEVDPRRYPMAGPPWPNISTGAQISPYGIQMVQADQVSDVAAGNRMVCIIDSGYYRAHDDLQYSNVTSSPDIGTGDPFVDRSSHGSHVAGTVSAIGNNGVGVRGVTQHQNLRIHIVKVFGDDGVFAYSSTLIHALTQCRIAGANVVSMSLGGAGQSTAERNAFADAFAAGVLSIAAAGNGASTAFSFPASYPSVVSVGGVDSSENHYTSSQRNNEVDIAAPAVAVLSTTTSVSEGRLVVEGNTYRGSPFEFSQSSGGSTGPLADGSFCAAPDPSWAGKVVLCQRGSGDGSTISFFQKVQSVQSGGGVAAVIYNNVAGHFTGTLGAGNTLTIPAISVSREAGLAALAFTGEDALVSSVLSAGPSMEGYSFFNGTSMATPHVSAVAALVWSHNPSWTNAEIRTALETTARDIGTPGRDDLFGHGIVQAKAALDFLCPAGCAPTGPAPAPTSEMFVDSSEGDFDTGGADLNARITPGDLRLSSTGDPGIDQQDLTASNQGFGTNAANWFGQTFTAGETGHLVQVDLNLFCSGCGAVTAPPNFIVSIRAVTGDLPTGPDLATATVPGFTNGAARWTAFTFAAPVSITAGERYAIVGRPAANLPGTAIYAYITAPGTPTALPNTYLAGQRVTSNSSGATWIAAVSATGNRDINFRTYTTGPLPHTFAPSGAFVSAIMDAKPATGFAAQWNELSWSATTPPGTSIRFQVAGSDTAAGPFNFVGPDGTNATSFTASNFPLTQFDGYRHLRYVALLETSDPSQTPVLHDVSTTMGTADAVAPVLSGVSVDKTVLWSPNHKLEDVVVSYEVSDNFDDAPVVRLSVTSNEPVDDPGSGNTSPDWEVGSSTLVRLRAERSGTGSGRVYTITITATDAAGNSSSATVTVTVPKSQ